MMVQVCKSAARIMAVRKSRNVRLGALARHTDVASCSGIVRIWNLKYCFMMLSQLGFGNEIDIFASVIHR
jgi:hypothetical protein